MACATRSAITREASTVGFSVPAAHRTHRRVVPTAQQASQIGPAEPTPPPRRARKPEWVRILEEDADVDDDVSQLLQGTDGDPDLIRNKMRAELSRKDMFMEGQGLEAPPRIAFRRIDPFNLWVWFEFARGPPSQRELDLLQAVVQAWFMVGKMGGYNSQNMQVFYRAGDDQSFFEYDNDELSSSQGSLLHDLTELESQGAWARCRVDMGSCDELALDVLLNMLVGFSRDVVGLSKVVVGGRNRDWALPEPDPESDTQFDIDPMQLPKGLDDDLELLDALEAQGVLKPRGGRVKGGGQAGQTAAADSADDVAGDDDGADAGPAAPPRKWGDGLMRRYSTDEFRRAFPSR